MKIWQWYLRKQLARSTIGQGLAMKGTFFHFSRVKIPSGQLLEPMGNHQLREEIESLLANTKPRNCIGRPQSIFVSEDEACERHGLPFDDGFLHQVELLGRSERRDNTWLGVLQLRLSDRPGMRTSGYAKYPELSNEAICLSYWAGKASDTPNREIATDKALVKECLDDEPRKLKRNIPLPS